jgi:hypothetical protein
LSQRSLVLKFNDEVLFVQLGAKLIDNVPAAKLGQCLIGWIFIGAHGTIEKLLRACVTGDVSGQTWH